MAIDRRLLVEMLHYDEKLPGCLEKLPERYPAEYVGRETFSRFSATKHAPGVSSVIYNALRMYARMTEDGWKGCAVGRTSNGNQLSEILVSGTPERPEIVKAVAISRDRGTVSGIRHVFGAGSTGIRVGKDADSGAEVLILALLPAILEEEEASESWEKLLPGLNIDPTVNTAEDFEAMIKQPIEVWGSFLATMCDNIYQRILNPGVKFPLPVTLTSSGEIKGIGNKLIGSAAYTPQPETIQGEFHVFVDGSRKASSAKREKKPSELRKAYGLGLTLTPEEAADVPDMPDELYSVPERVEEICRLIKGSTDLPNPIRTWMELGPAGTGKTTDVKLAASILGLGYAKITCNAGTELFDLVGQVFPNDGGSAVRAGEILAANDLPSMDDLEFGDLAENYRRIVKDPNAVMPKGFSKEEARSMLLQAFLDAQGKMAKDTRDFVFAEGVLARCISKNYVIEMQEVMTPQQQGVLVGLNSIMETGGSLELPNGKSLKKGKYTCIAMTSNGTDYAGNLELQGSVESRNALVYEVPNPPVKVMAENAMKQSGLNDKALAEQMAQIVQSISEWREKHGISHGSCGPRELIFWMTAVAIDGPDSVGDHAITCVINKATHDPQERLELIESFLDAAGLCN